MSTCFIVENFVNQAMDPPNVSKNMNSIFLHDRKPIHIPGTIQPHGVLLSFRETDFEIQWVSHNTEGLATPSVILLDLNLPSIDGRDALERLKQDGSLKEIPIVVFTTSSSPKDAEFCY
jgi:CheY-like chemotaxis protein